MGASHRQPDAAGLEMAGPERLSEVTGKSEGAQVAQATRRQGIESETMAMRETKS